MWFGTFLVFSCLILIKSSPAPTHLLVTRVGPCEDEPQDIISVSELKISTQSYDSTLSGTLNITENIEDGWKIKVVVEKCLDMRNRDTCDHFRSFSLVRDGCNDDGENEQIIYTMLFHYINPKLECPIQSGSYEVLNYPFFTQDNYVPVYEAKISTSVFGYIYRLLGYSQDKRKMLCVEAYVQLIYIRDHVWVQKTDIKSTTVGLPSSKFQIEDEDIADNKEYDKI
ncbi:unnamed protein product [Arctia plantaginis]|uniref:Uncharacterized protein n=1 Tax=Arctia plantaginis TaxID=874455 RepID=A0A8S1AI32_ARCPL|nr:unnamed protein product [Arctia plantaginis]CAB3260501.1 unnamed protein product [Arctia plantaginis]